MVNMILTFLDGKAAYGKYDTGYYHQANQYVNDNCFCSSVRNKKPAKKVEKHNIFRDMFLNFSISSKLL